MARGPGSASVRLVAPEGPVTAAVRAGRGETIEAERSRLRGLVARIRAGLEADHARIDACLAGVAARRSLREDGGCA